MGIFVLAFDFSQYTHCTNKSFLYTDLANDFIPVFL